MDENKEIIEKNDTPYDLAARVIFVFSILAALVCSITHTLVLFFRYVPEYGIADKSVAWVSASYIFTALAVAAIAVCALSIKKDYAKTLALPAKNGALTTLTSALAGFMVIASVVVKIISDGGFAATGVRYSNVLGTLNILLALFAIPAGVYFILTASGRDTAGKYTSLCGLFTPVWYAIYLMYVYFERKTSLNDPVNIMTQMALISFMLYLLFELRFLLGKAKPRAYVAVSGISIVLCFAGSIAKIAATVGGVLEAGPDIIFSCAILASGLYALCRMTSVIFPRRDK